MKRHRGLKGSILRYSPPQPMPVTDPSATREFAQQLHALGALQFGEFTLKDGSVSPVYCDLRLLISDPRTLKSAATHYGRVLSALAYDRIAAIPYAGLPIGAAVALEVARPMIFPRKETKNYGRKRAIEGHWNAGERAVLLDDLITSGKSKLEAAEPLREAGLVVEDIVVLIDRRPKGEDDLKDAGLAVYAAFELSELATSLVDCGKLSKAELAAIDRLLN